MVMQKTTRRYIWLALFMIVLLAVAGFRLRGREVSAARVERRDLLQTVVATGRVATLARAEVGSQVVGTVAGVLVEIGSPVSSGQPLIRLRDEQERAALAQAEAVLTEAELRLAQLRRVDEPLTGQLLREAEANLLNSRSVYSRTVSLYETGVLSRAEQDEARRALTVAESQVERERLRLASSRPAGSDFQLAESRLAQSRAALSLARERLRQTIITSPGIGRVIGRSVEAGDVVQPGKPLMVISRPGRTQIIAQIDEKHLGQLLVGQDAKVSADAYPDKSFSARLSTLVPAVDPQRGTVEARFDVVDPPAYLVPDMTVSLEVQVGLKTGVLTLSSDAVRESTTAPWVLVVRDGRALRQDVRVGMRGTATLEIVSGLSAGDAVVPPAESQVSAGQRVQVRASGGGGAH
jgi:HlyD family secretion protein